jgi:hypothetical protein
MLERDNPPGRPITIWGVACREFKIDYKPYMLKCAQREMFLEETYVKRAFIRLFKQKLILPVWAEEEGFSLVPPLGGGIDFVSWVLTAEGRRVAEQLKAQEQLLEEQREAVNKVLDSFGALGCEVVTVSQVLEELWRNLCGSFVSREEFDKCWNNTKLGLMLRECTVRKVRMGMKDRHQKYYLI